MNHKLFKKLMESVDEMNTVSSLVSDKPKNQAIAIAMEKAGKTRKDKGKQARKQKGKSYRS